MRYESLEKWMNIYGYGGDYQVSNLGRVRSIKYGDYRIRKTFIAGKGYECIDLCKNGKPVKVYVHRLVASQFIKNENKECTEVNHKDGNKLNNKADNLEWVDGVSNMKHAREKLGFTNMQSAKLSEKDVVLMFRKYKSGNYMIKDIAKEFGVHSKHASSIFRGRFWKHLKLA